MKDWGTSHPSIPFSPMSLNSKRSNPYKMVPQLLREYPDLFQDISEKGLKEEFWKKTEKKINELLVQDSLTAQKKFSVLKRFIYKILKEKHMLSKCFKKTKLRTLKRNFKNTMG
jgi:hypothetical protein